jgi:exonuclease III
MSKAEILLIQETKMEEKDFLNTTKALWKNNQGIAENARGASGGIGTLWNTMKFDLIRIETCTHWIYTSLLHKETGRLVSLFNLYVPVLLDEKRICWDTLKDFLLLNDLENIIIGGDLNVTLAAVEKKGGSIVQDPTREWVEDIMSEWELEDVKPTKGKYTWSNKRVGSGHIAARLDRFLVQSSFMLLGLTPSSSILPHSVSNHKPIMLEVSHDRNLRPIPFRFSPAWLQYEGFQDLVTKIWNETVRGSAFFIWEEKLWRLKVALKSWAKTQSTPVVTHQEAQKQLEKHQLEMDEQEITPETLHQEDQLQRNWHQACREEEKYWQ